jgi:hypothetical protein
VLAAVKAWAWDVWGSTISGDDIYFDFDFPVDSFVHSFDRSIDCFYVSMYVSEMRGPKIWE